MGTWRCLEGGLGSVGGGLAGLGAGPVPPLCVLAHSPQHGGAVFTLSAVPDALSILGAVALVASPLSVPTHGVGFTSSPARTTESLLPTLTHLLSLLSFNLSLSKSSLLNAPNLTPKSQTPSFARVVPWLGAIVIGSVHARAVQEGER